MTKEVMWSNLEAASLQAAMDLENRTQILTTMTEDTPQNVTRRNFMKGVIAAGAVASSSAYLFRTTTLHGQPSHCGTVDGSGGLAWLSPVRVAVAGNDTYLSQSSAVVHARMASRPEAPT